MAKGCKPSCMCLVCQENNSYVQQGDEFSVDAYEERMRRRKEYAQVKCNKLSPEEDTKKPDDSDNEIIVADLEEDKDTKCASLTESKEWNMSLLMSKSLKETASITPEAKTVAPKEDWNSCLESLWTMDDETIYTSSTPQPQVVFEGLPPPDELGLARAVRHLNECAYEQGLQKEELQELMELIMSGRDAQAPQEEKDDATKYVPVADRFEPKVLPFEDIVLPGLPLGPPYMPPIEQRMMTPAWMKTSPWMTRRVEEERPGTSPPKNSTADQAEEEAGPSEIDNDDSHSESEEEIPEQSEPQKKEEHQKWWKKVWLLSQRIKQFAAGRRATPAKKIKVINDMETSETLKSNHHRTSVRLPRHSMTDHTMDETESDGTGSLNAASNHSRRPPALEVLRECSGVDAEC